MPAIASAISTCCEGIQEEVAPRQSRRPVSFWNLNKGSRNVQRSATRFQTANLSCRERLMVPGVEERRSIELPQTAEVHH